MMEQEYARLLGVVNDALDGCFNQSCKQAELLEAMRYSLLAGGKRIRPVLVLAFCNACGGREEDALNAACGVEMLHTYSLIHDDLPCMDNDDLRRGMPTCHKVYGETNAVLAGDALQAAAFYHVLSSPVSAEKTSAMAATLAEAAGERGMCGGQFLDTCKENEEEIDENALYLIHSLKTGALLKAACVMGVQCAGGNAEQLRAAGEFAYHLGMAFQIRDDVLDVVSTAQELGKDVGSDEQMGKTTFASLLGTEQCGRLVREHTEKAKSALGDAFGDASFLIWLAESLAERRK
jgi:geranylgeranyl diphosphate synthase type II